MEYGMYLSGSDVYPLRLQRPGDVPDDPSPLEESEQFGVLLHQLGYDLLRGISLDGRPTGWLPCSETIDSFLSERGFPLEDGCHGDVERVCNLPGLDVLPSHQQAGGPGILSPVLRALCQLVEMPSLLP